MPRPPARSSPARRRARQQRERVRARPQADCRHDDAFRLYKRGPFPQRTFKTWGWWCPDCDRLIARDWEPLPRDQRDRSVLA